MPAMDGFEGQKQLVGNALQVLSVAALARSREKQTVSPTSIFAPRGRDDFLTPGGGEM
jgi:hypothetical protein